MLKQSRVYNLVEAPEISLEELEEAMEKHRSRDLGGPQAKGFGWTSPAGRNSDDLVVEVQAQRLLAVMKQERVLPGSVVKDEVEQKKEEIEDKQGEKLTSKEVKALKEEVTESLLPRAFVKKGTTLVWWDTRRNRIHVAASSAAQADAALDLLRETLGSLKVVPMATKNLPVRVMTEWLRDPSSRPEWLKLGDDATLADGDGGTTFGIKKADLDGAEVEAMLANGCLAEKLSISCESEAAFEVDTSLAIKKIKLSDRIVEEMDNVEDDDPLGRLQTEFIITADAISNVLGMLEEAMGGANMEMPEEPAEEENAA